MNKKQSCVYNCDDLLSYNSSPRSSRISTVASRQKKDHFAHFWVLAPKLAQTFLGLCRTDSEGVPRNRAFSGEGRGGFVKVTQSLAMFSKSKGLSASVSFLPLPLPPPSFFGSCFISRAAKTRESRSSVFLCYETKRKRLRRRLKTPRLDNRDNNDKFQNW